MHFWDFPLHQEKFFFLIKNKVHSLSQIRNETSSRCKVLLERNRDESFTEGVAEFYRAGENLFLPLESISDDAAAVVVCSNWEEVALCWAMYRRRSWRRKP